MSITVTPSTNSFGLPRFNITISSTSGAAITAVSLTRTSSGSTVPTRVQPTIGPSPRTLSDYEADWDTAIGYTAIVTTASGTESFLSPASLITSTDPWAIHPTTPALSIRLDHATPTVAGIQSVGNVTRAATDTAHNVLGSAYRTYTKTGPRAASTTQLVITTTTTLEAQSVRALVNDLTPLLIRVPAALNWDIEVGYYRVGDVDEARFQQYGPDPTRVFTLPLERVEEPAGSQQSERTWANVVNDFSSWAAVRAAYSTWTDVLTDTRS